MDVHRVAVEDVAVGVEIARLEHDAPGGVGDRDVQPDNALGVEAGGNVVAVGAVAELDAERDAVRARTIDDHVAELVPRLQQRKPLLGQLVE